MVGLAAKVAFLSRPDAYPEGTLSVETRETHMSWVFLTDRHAYKLKKPVRTRFLDYGTIAARRLNCRREIRLNRRLAPDVYLDATTLRNDARTGLHLDGDGRVVDWLVRMKRLPADRTLESRIAAGSVREMDVRRLAHRLALFFASAQPARMSADAYLRTMADSVRASRAEMAQPLYGLPQDKLDKLAAMQLSFLSRERGLLRSRAPLVREGHGDLRPEHVYCNGTPIVMDCLEFNRQLRLLDPIDELAYLAMECERLGDPRVGRWLFDTYRRETGDAPARRLIWFYKCFRAYVRATIAIRHLADAAVREPERWHKRTLHYLACAETFARSLDGTGQR